MYQQIGFNAIGDDGKNFNCRFVRGRGGRVQFDPTTATTTLQETGDELERVYDSKLACLEALVAKMACYAAAGDESYNYNHNYTSAYNSWLMATGYMYASCSFKEFARTTIRPGTSEVKRTLRWATREGIVEVVSEGDGSSVRLANNRSCFQMFWKVRKMALTCVLPKSNQIHRVGPVPVVQVDTPEKLTEQGDATQSSDKQQNTIITLDQAQTIQSPTQALDSLCANTSSEPTQHFPAFTQRWMPLDTVSVATSAKTGDLLKSYYLPEGLYTAAKCAPNLTPFETYIYGRMDIEVRIVVNANKFQCGKLLLSSKYDTFQADTLQAGMQSGLSRNHIIVDLTANNEGVLNIPFRYHRPWVRLVKNDANSIGVRPSKYCSLYVHVLSALQTGPSGSSEVSIRLFYRFKHVEFTGMSYRVAVQALGLEDVVSQPTCKALKEILVGAEKAFDQLGQSRNQDKPGKVEGTIIVPRPRLNFGSGKGIIDVQPLRVNPHTLTNYKNINCPDDEPKTFQEMARIWGLVRTSTWSAEDKAATSIITFNIDPMMRSYVKDYSGEITPLEYACSNFCFWSGTIELRFDFVSNSFHTGTVQISAEFGRTTPSETECESSSTYTKMFHLGEQKSVAFRVPYIYDTIMRRTTDTVFNPYRKTTTDDTVKNAALCIAPLSNTFVKMRVINQLRPVSSAPQSIEILTFMRAGPDFVMHGLKNFGIMSYNITNRTNNFPEDGYVTVARAKREFGKPGDPIRVINPKPPSVYMATQLPEIDRNIWGEYKPERLKPRIQMDTGEKENNDTTDDFRVGRTNMLVQTMDCHTSFKDLLRRPYLLISNIDVKPQKAGGFFIPIMPPSRNLSYLLTDAQDEANSIWAQTIDATSAKSIMDCFRVWRGGMRYTIVVNSGTKPIYVSLVPHSGVRIVGGHSAIDRDNYPLYGCNFNTEIIIPSINPTAVIEAPYDTENTWTYTFEEDPTRNYSWRDKGDTNAGHIVINTSETVNMSIFWSAADDFEIANFYGVPYGKQNGWAYRWDDRRPKVQMADFPDIEPNTTVDRLSRIMNKKNMVRAAVSAIPYVGPGLAIGSVVDEIQTNVETATDSVARNMERVSDIAEKLSCDVESISSALRMAIDKAGATVSGLINGSVLLYDFLLDVLMAWMEKSWRIVAIGIVRFVTKIVPTFATSMWDSMQHYIVALATYLQRITTEALPTVQAEASHEATLSGILLGIVGTLFGVVLDSRRQRSYPAALFERLTQTTGIQYLLSVLRFIQGVFDTLRTLVMEALGYVSPEAQALKKLSENNETINQFIREAQIITSESNSSCLNSARYRRRFWKTVLSAHQIQRLMCSVPTNCVSGQLARLCGDVIKVGNEKFMDVSASPVRYEPMVICIEGPPGTGKSYATEEIVHRLLKAIGFTQPSSEHIFYRTAGEKFWSGYRDQPVVVYDEWLNVTDPQRCTDMVTEIMKLKSTSVFIPEMAHLEEKKIKGNPYLIIMLCNSAFPNIADYARCPTAVYRRRDLVLHCSRLHEYEGVDLRDEEVGDLGTFPHLQFQIYKDPTKHTSLSGLRKNFNDTVIFLENRFARYWAREKIEVEKRMAKLPEFAVDADPHSIRLEDPFSLFYQLNHHMQEEYMGQNAWTPYEQLEMAVFAVSNAIEHHQNRAPPVEEVPEKMEWSDIIQPTQTQGPLGTFVAGLFLEGSILNYIAGATLPTLTRWEEQMAPIRTVLAECLICKDQAECAFVCEASRESTFQHTLCVGCYRTSVVYSMDKCPLCRCNTIVPILGQEDLASLAVWTRLAFHANRGLQWLCKKVMSWFGWRERRPTITFITDYLVAIFLSIPTWLRDPTEETYYATGAMSMHLARNVTNSVVQEITLQSDNWDDVVEGPSTSTDYVVEIPADVLAPEINVGEFEKLYAQAIDHQVCLHHEVFAKGTTASLNGTFWTVIDLQSNRRIKISIFPCKTTQCPLHERGRYQLLLESYMNRNKNMLRELNIRYYNDPSAENLSLIPTLFWKTWMTGYKEPALLSSWWDYLSDIWAHYKTFITYTLGLGTVVCTVIGIYKLATSFTSPIIAQFGGSEYSTDSPRHRRAPLHTRTERRYFQSATENPSVFESVQKYICKNTVKFSLVVDGKAKIMYGVGLFGHYVLVPRHYVVEMKRGIAHNGLITVEPYARPHEKINLNLSLSDLIESMNTDLAYLKLPANFQIFKDLRKYLCTEDDLDKPLPASGILMACPGRGKEYMREVLTDIQGISSSQIIMDQDNNAFEVQDVLVYGYSQPGVCGSLLLREKHQRPILSMHFAGVGDGLQGEGFGVLLTQEALAVLVQIDSEPCQLEDRQFGSIEDAAIFYNDTDVNIHYLGTVPKDQVPYIPTKSNLVKSILYGVPGLTTILEPTILDKHDPRYVHQTTPLYEGVRKHGILTENFLREELLAAKEMLWSGWVGNLKPLVAQPSVLTVEEAIVGFPEHEYYKAMDLKTSAGYPYVCGPKKKKIEYIEPLRDEQEQIIGVASISPIVTATMEYKEDLRKQGIIPVTIFIDTLKDEKRKQEKARRIGGTRVFCSSPVDYSIECRRYFMHFIAAFMKDRMNMMHGVGINPTSGEWGQLLNKLLKINTKFVTIDYSNFGPGYNAGVAEIAYELMIDWVMLHVKGVDRRYLRILVWECIQSTHIVNNTVYQQHGGSPSGAVFTTIVNTLVNQLYVLLAWRKLMRSEALNQKQSIVSLFKKHVALFTYGDDLIMTVSEQYQDQFNALTLTDYFRKYNIVATNASKSQDIAPYSDLSQATFLKRGFLKHPTRRGEWLSPLDWESVVGATQWVWKSANLKESTLINCNAALLQAHGHGREKYYEFKKHLDTMLKRKKLPITNLLWEEIDDLFFTTGLEYITDNIINQI
nr:MAG: polyprotein [Totiviridae sp.]